MKLLFTFHFVISEFSSSRQSSPFLTFTCGSKTKTHRNEATRSKTIGCFDERHKLTWNIYLLIPQISVCKSVILCLYLAYLANLSHDRLRARLVCCMGPDNVQSCVRLFRCEQVKHFIEFRGGDTLMFIVRHLQFAECVSVARWCIWTPGGQYITTKRHISQCPSAGRTAQLLHPNECTRSHRSHPQRAHALVYIFMLTKKGQNIHITTAKPVYCIIGHFSNKRASCVSNFKFN